MMFNGSSFLLKRALDPSSCRNQNQQSLRVFKFLWETCWHKGSQLGDGELFQPERFLKEFALLQNLVIVNGKCQYKCQFHGLVG